MFNKKDIFLAFPAVLMGIILYSGIVYSETLEELWETYILIPFIWLVWLTGYWYNK